MLARRLGLAFVDADAELERRLGVTIPMIFEIEGEAIFRDREEATLAYQTMKAEHPAYRRLRAPALAIYAVTDSVSQLEPWQRADTVQLEGLRDLVRGVGIATAQSRAMFRTQVAHGTVLELHGAHHWIFVSNRDQVLAAIREFLSRPN